MSELYAVTVISVVDRKVVFELTLRHPDAPGAFPEARSLALALIRAAPGAGTSPLGRAITDDDRYSNAFMRVAAPRFVERIERLAVSGWTPGSPARVGAKATYEATVTDPRWLEHMKPGRWKTAASADPEEVRSLGQMAPRGADEDDDDE